MILCLETFSPKRMEYFIPWTDEKYRIFYYGDGGVWNFKLISRGSFVYIFERGHEIMNGLSQDDFDVWNEVIDPENGVESAEQGSVPKSILAYT
ncbi:hypothetical protein ACFL6D_05315 [Spirochaetota bacterium]